MSTEPSHTMPAYIPTIGLEIHAELSTKSKMFCSCRNEPDQDLPNIHICPICMGHPGTLPVLNKEAIRHVLSIGHAVRGKIADFTEWDRKNYFYPDIPKGYQLSQFKYPLVSGGVLSGVEITRIHLEEDTAQSTHDAAGIHILDKSLVNFNRAGVPLMELVTEPVIHDAATAVRFAKELQLLLRYLGAGEANMEKGEMRVEANISVATPEDTAARRFGTKTEIKNLNSFRAVERAIAYEVNRQIAILEATASGDVKIVQETRGWDDSAQKTFSQRAKESSHDYRYFPDPDIPKMVISEIPDFAESILKKNMPELPWDKRLRFKKDFDMTDKEVAVFVESPRVAAYFESVIAQYANSTADAAPASQKNLIRLSINYILSDYLGLIKKTHGEDIEKGIDTIAPPAFAKLIKLTASSTVSSRGAKDVLALMYAQSVLHSGSGAGAATDSSDSDPQAIAEKNGLIQKSDEGELIKIVGEIVAAHPNVVAEYKAGKTAALQFLVGQAMKITKGSANPGLLKEIILKSLA